MKQINVYEARGRFSQLIEQAEAGEEIVIARNGKPVVRLVPVRQPERTLGRWAGMAPSLSSEDWADADRAVAALFAESLERR